MLFTRESHLDVLENSKAVGADGTFKVKKKFFRQIFTIDGEINGKMVPLVFVLMKSKTKKAFYQCLPKDHFLFASLQPSSFILERKEFSWELSQLNQFLLVGSALPLLYLAFVISFTRAGFWDPTFYTQKLQKNTKMTKNTRKL